MMATRRELVHRRDMKALRARVVDSKKEAGRNSVRVRISELRRILDHIDNLEADLELAGRRYQWGNDLSVPKTEFTKRTQIRANQTRIFIPHESIEAASADGEGISIDIWDQLGIEVHYLCTTTQRGMSGVYKRRFTARLLTGLGKLIHHPKNRP